MKIKHQLFAFLPIAFGLIPLASCSNISFQEKSVKTYFMSPASSTDIKLYFSNTYPGIPFINLDDELTQIFLLAFRGDKNLSFTTKKDKNTFTFVRENGASATVDFANNLIKSDNLNLFKATSFAKTSLDERSENDSFYDSEEKKIEGEVRFTTVKNEKQACETKAKPITMYLDYYNIKTYKTGDKYLVPFTTFYNALCNSSISCLYNGESLFFSSQLLSQASAEYEELFYSTFSPQSRSQALKEYNYNELCRDLDFTYGLASEHNISSFTSFMEDNGLKSLLLSDSRDDEAKAYYELQCNYFADFHSGFTIPNAYGGKISEEDKAKIKKDVHYNPAYLESVNINNTTKANRIKYKNLNDSGTILSPITLADSGKTLIITFDSFAMSQKVDWYYENFNTADKRKTLMTDTSGKYDALKYDTVALISYANDLIHNDLDGDRKIENVVIDLSGNGGGAADTAIFTLSWLDSAMMHLSDPIADYHGSISYASDINFDKKIDGNDLLVFADPTAKSEYKTTGGKNAYEGKVYCLTSNASFSCGNYVPAMLKQSGLAKLVGSKSGGGACIVHVSGTADGSGISFSSNKKLCKVVNGSYYSIDEGVDVDYPLNDPSTLYGGTGETISDRSNLVNYLNSLE